MLPKWPTYEQSIYKTYCKKYNQKQPSNQTFKQTVSTSPRQLFELHLKDFVDLVWAG